MNKEIWRILYNFLNEMCFKGSKNDDSVIFCFWSVFLYENYAYKNFWEKLIKIGKSYVAINNQRKNGVKCFSYYFSSHLVHDIKVLWNIIFSYAIKKYNSAIPFIIYKHSINTFVSILGYQCQKRSEAP